ncbi:MAG TPA: carboxypeptidase regulatory-like domain-containing protein [Vicinamibacterales bacterium]|nr:carboxypeptidase regulatory-like domain-containing protein [Vicinamibacterales bacterium]
MRDVVRTAWLAVAVGLWPAFAISQELAGTVRDTSGAVLPGVTVEASSPALIEKVRSTVTDGAGQYRILDLRPGTYTVTFSLPGFTTVRRENVEVSGAGVITINVEMRVGGVQETITVVGETPVVDVQSTRRQTVLDNELVNVLPATRGYGALLNAVPAIQGGYMTTQIVPQMNFFTTHGGRPNEGKVQIDGLDVGAAFNGGGVSGFAYDTANAEEVQVVVSGGLGESQTGGPLLNIVPRTGGNAFSGSLFGSTAGKWSQGSNLDEELRRLGFTDPPVLHKAWDLNGALGGPVVRDRVWFFGTVRDFGSHSDVFGRFGNAVAGDPTRWDYVEDRSVQARNASSNRYYSGRITAQATPRHKIGVSYEHQEPCAGSSFVRGDRGCRSRGDNWIAAGTANSSPEANTVYNDGLSNIFQATWTSPATSRLLFEAGVSSHYSRWGWMEPPGGLTNLTPVTEVSNRYGVPNFTYRGLDNFFDNNYRNTNWRASVSYVTGSHSLKFGYQAAYYMENTEDFQNATGLTYVFNNGQPIQFNWRIAPWQTSNRTSFYAFYVQDVWTVGRATLQGALRFDHAWSWHPADHNGAPRPGPFNPQPIRFPLTEGVKGYNDFSPRLGLAYDVFGTGKTAFKVNIGRYLQAAVNQTQYVINNPALDGRNGRGGPRFITTTGRAWQDVNGNRIPDCTIMNPAAQDNSATGGDICGPWLNPNFGNPAAFMVVNPEVLEGWGVRPYDWQFGVSVQQELAPRVSLEVGYNRRWWGNFPVVDNRAVGPNDFIPYTVTAPRHPELPEGGGYTFTALLPTTLRQDLWYTFSKDYGDETRYWHGVDVTLHARLRNGLTVTGGTSTGRGVRDNCEIVDRLPETLFAFGVYQRRDGCKFAEDWITTFRGSAAYTIPRVDVLVSTIVRFQNTAPGFFTTGDVLPGTNGNSLGATMFIPNTTIQQLTGTLPPGGLPTGFTQVNLVRTGELFPEQVRTVDVRFAKLFRVGTTRTDVAIDLYNLFNTSKPVAYNQTFGFDGATWLRPTQIADARFARFNVTFSF